jgi:hypothetical protein
MRLQALIPALCLALAGPAFAAERPSLVPPDGQRASYLWTMTRHSPAGDLDGSAAVVLHGRTPPGSMQVSVTVDGADHTYVAKSSADGSLDFIATKHESSIPELVRLDQVARLAGGAGTQPKLGDTFKLNFDEPVPGGAIGVTVQARVTSVDGDVVRVEADGVALGTIALPQPQATAEAGGSAFLGGAPPGRLPGGAPTSMSSEVDDGSEKSKDTTMDVKLHLHLSASFAGGVLVEARGSQVASPVKGPNESIETDWSFTKS